MPTPLRLAIAGCGNIANAYKSRILAYPETLQLVGAFDIDVSRAEKLVEDIGGTAYATLDDLLADEQVQLVVNLTVHHAHVEVITKCLAAGKHVYSEKPLALAGENAWAMVELAENKGLRLASAPITFLGHAQQLAASTINEGKLGQVRVAYAEMNWNRIEAWHPAPQPFFEVGSMFDVGVYPLTVLVNLFGAVATVNAFGEVLMPERHTTGGEPFTITTPDWICAWLTFHNGVRVRLTTTFYAGPSYQTGIEFHGDDATLHLTAADRFNAPVKLRGRKAGEWEELPLPEDAFSGIDWAVGLVDLAAAIEEDRPHKASAKHAAHVVEIAGAVHESITTGQPVTLENRL